MELLPDSEAEPYYCGVCGKEFLVHALLEKHLKTHTVERRFSCDICGKDFLKNSHLTRHIRTHTGEKPFHCDICGKDFSENYTLKNHIKTHTGEKPFHCDICDKDFTERSTLKKHLRIHTGEKPYHCTLCGDSFTDHSTLRCHLKKHTREEKSFQCETCSKNFTTKAALKGHIRIHKKEKTFPCKECGKEFSLSLQLKAHMKTHAKPEPQLKSNILRLSHCEAKKHKASTPQQTIPLTNFIKTEYHKTSMLEANLAMLICFHSSFNSCDHLIELCKNYMFDSDIMSKVKLHHTKCANIVRNVLAPYFDGDLISDIGDRKFSLLLNESNDISITKLLGIVIYYSDTHKKVVHTYLSMVSLETCNADGIVDALKIELAKKELDIKNLLVIGTDNARVMIGVNNGFPRN
ncbi:finger 271 [Octopus vulgaris]|uniref:Finger 271 n=1 Tax=Octopus vulgaris TaxID=6645 RepID=A0AA36B3I1_OCTVU|nr:finger 271 [Octopus vulgaris]